MKFNDRWFDFPERFSYGWDILTAPERFILVQAGRRALKTESSKRRLVLSLIDECGWDKPRYGYAAPTRIQAKDIAWEDLKELTPNHWKKSVSETELKITTHWGSSVQVFGLDQAQRIEGGGFNGFVVDERQDVKPRAITTSIMPALADRDGWLIEQGVAKRQGVGAVSFNKKINKALAGKLSNTRAFCWESSEVLSEEQLRDFKEVMDEKDYDEQFRAIQVKAGGGVFYNWSEVPGEGNVKPCPYDKTKPILVGSDFNVDPMCWCLGQEHIVDGVKELHIIDEVWKRETNVEATLKYLWAKWKHHEMGWFFYGDASGKNRSASDTEYATTCLKQIKNDKNFDKYRTKRVVYNRANPRILKRIQSCTSLIKSASGKKRLFVDPKCEHVREDLSGRVFKEGKTEMDDGLLQGHMTDALGYLIHTRYPYKLDTGSYAAPVVMSGS